MPNLSALFRLSLLIFYPVFSFAQEEVLLTQIKEIAKEAKGKVSVSVLCIEDRKSVAYYGDEPCVMQSVFKFPIALAILDRIDKGEFSLQHKIHITPKEMIKDTWSPMRDSFPEGNVNVTFENLLRYMVSQSDNIACDVLLHHLGKPKVVEKYIRKLEIEDFAMKYNEAGMHKKWENQYKNTCSPNAMVQLLDKFYQHKILSDTNSIFLYKLMIETKTGLNRIVKQLPPETIVAHKTGTSDAKDGMTAAINDVGIITLPNGKHIALAVFVNDAYASQNTIEEVIARIAKATFDTFSK